MKRTVIKRTLAALLCALLLLTSLSAAAFAADKKKIAQCKISVQSAVTYTGKARKAAVTVKDGKTVLKNGTDYTLAYANNKKIGTATVTVTAKKGSSYTGSKTLKFKIIPAKVKNLAAAKTTKNTVKLTWKAVKGATGYSIYTYDKTAKTYTRVKNAKSTAATVKNLKAGKAYTFAVRAFAKAGGKTYQGAYSDRLKVKTAAEKISGDLLAPYRKMIRSGTYLMTFKTNMEEFGNAPVTIAAKNGNTAIDSKIQGMNVRMIYLPKSGKTYLLLKDMRMYSEIPASMLEGEDLDFSAMAANMFAENDGAMAESTLKKDGKTYNVRSAERPDGTTIRYLFDGKKLVEVDAVNPDGSVDSTYITKLTGDVPDDMFRIPKGYGYMSLDWLEAIA